MISYKHKWRETYKKFGQHKDDDVVKEELYKQAEKENRFFYKDFFDRIKNLGASKK